MKIGPKYKIARRLGAGVFEKTQSQKFILSEQKKQKRRRGPTSSYGQQLLEKQKVRYTYAVSEKQLSSYVKDAVKQNPSNAASSVFEKLEKRLDSIVLRAGFAPTRLAARQMVSHGHVMVNGVKTTIPSYQVTESDKITIKPGSADKGLFQNIEERFAEQTPPSWISLDKTKKEISLKGVPVYNPSETPFTLSSVVQYYKR